MLLTYSLHRLQVQLNDVNSEIFFLNICKVGEYFISFGTEFHIWLHLQLSIWKSDAFPDTYRWLRWREGSNSEPRASVSNALPPELRLPLVNSGWCTLIRVARVGVEGAGGN